VFGGVHAAENRPRLRDAFRLFFAKIPQNPRTAARWQILVPPPLVLPLMHHQMQLLDEPPFQKLKFCVILRARKLIRASSLESLSRSPGKPGSKDLVRLHSSGFLRKKSKKI